MQRQFFLQKKIKSEPKPISVKTDVASKLRRAPPRSTPLPSNWDESDVDTTFNMYVSMFTSLYDKDRRDEMQEVPVADLPWFYDTWTDEE